MSIFGEQEIRPKELMGQQRVTHFEDIERLLSKYSEFLDVDCPACGENNFVYKFKKNSIKYVECKECRTFYVNPRPSPNILEWFYQGSQSYAYWNDVIFPASETARLQKIFVPRVDQLLDLCAKFNVDMNAILEIGAGFGTFCSEVKKRGLFNKVIAVEPTPNLAKTCKERGLEVIEQPVEKIEFDSIELFDVVASFEVIEHIFDPINFIKHMKNLLKPGGIIMLTCPNGQGFDVETLGPISDTVDHEHLNYFNPESLTKLLTNLKMEVLEVFTPGVLDAELVRNKILEREFDVSEEPFLKKVLLDDWDKLGGPFQNFLIEQGLSSNMWIVARKA